MAARLFVSENTVKTHCSRLFDKLGVDRRTQAVQAGKTLGLIPDPIGALGPAVTRRVLFEPGPQNHPNG